jgi:hypothetical protein
MAKPSLSMRVLLGCLLYGILAPACGSKGVGLLSQGDGDGDLNNPGTGGFVSTGGLPGTGGNSSSGGTSGSACEGLTAPGGEDPLIDDFEHVGSSSLPMVGNRRGTWFIANDGTFMGQQAPQNGQPTPNVGRTGAGFASTASGFQDWGALFGVSLNDVGGNACGYNASHFTGISFWARTGDGSSKSIRVGLPIPAIIPRSRGGTCSGVGCDDNHFKVVLVGGEWELVTIEWADLQQNSAWVHDNKYAFDPTNIAQITFGVDGTTQSYNLIIDDLMFTGGDTNVGGQGGALIGQGGAG